MGKAQAAAKGGFIDVELSSEERVECLAWGETPNVLENALQQLVDDKYQVKISYDPGNDCYVTYISGHWKLNKPDSEWTLTGRGSTVRRALLQGLYKHFQMLDGKWDEWKHTPQRQADWD